MRGAKRRSNPAGDILPLDCFAPLAMTAAQVRRPRHCEEQSDEAIQTEITPAGLLRSASNDGPSEAASSLRGAKRRSNPDGDILPLSTT
ncbi:MAG: hypothetical protein LBT00_01840 [Spirochaetaceae bacterium]|nr:hypothetical protein [Spirochaetaceae bacterium]